MAAFGASWHVLARSADSSRGGFMTHYGPVRVLAFILILPCSALFAQTDLVVNGSFELGLSNWSTGAVNEATASGTCSYNAAAAPGTETLTSTPGFPATNGTGIVLGSISSSGGTGARTNCVLYQDVAIPAGTGTLTLKFDFGAKAGNDGCLNTGMFVGLYPTSTVPGIASAALGGSATSICTSSPASTLVTFNVPKNAVAVAGTTVRLAFIDAANVFGHEVVGMDNVQLLATPAVPTVAGVSPSSGPLSGGNTVTITGTNCSGATSVTFAGVAALSFTVVNATTITAVVPGGTAGSVSVVVTGPGGNNSANALYAYMLATPVPSLGTWGMILLASLLIFYGWFSLRRGQPGMIGRP
jgi:hypothetical protein